MWRATINSRMKIIMPAAGLSTRFPNMKPKYSLTDSLGKMMVENALSPYLGKYPIILGLLQENEIKFPVCEYIKDTYGDQISIVMLKERTKGPADTVYQILKAANTNDTEILIKDCDSFFNHEYQTGNYICVSDIKDHKVLRRLSEKSFVVLNNQGIVSDIIEKEVISNKFCVGGYKFESSDKFVSVFEQLTNQNIKEIFVSHIIQQCLNTGVLFKESTVQQYHDVGTANEWEEWIQSSYS